MHIQGGPEKVSNYHELSLNGIKNRPSVATFVII